MNTLTPDQKKWLKDSCDMYEQGLTDGLVGLPPAQDLDPPARVVYDHGYGRGLERLLVLECMRQRHDRDIPLH